MSGSYNGTYTGTTDVTNPNATFSSTSLVDVMGEAGISSEVGDVRIVADGTVTVLQFGGVGVYLAAGGSVINGSSAEIQGYKAAA